MKAIAILEKWDRIRRKDSQPALLDPEGRCLRTWAEVEAESLAMTERLKGDRSPVVLQLPNHPSFPALLLACWRTDRAVCLVDATLRSLEGLAGVVGPGLHVTAASGALQFARLSTSPTPANSTCLFKLTSGTTSLPQPIPFTAEQLIADCDQICSGMGIREDDINFGTIAFTHSFGFSNLITPLICNGSRLVVSNDALPRAIQRSLTQTGATVLPLVPAMFRALCAVDSLPPGLRLCISAGAPLDVAVARDFYLRFHQKIHSFYGASESGGICYDASKEPNTEPGFVGTPLPGVEVSLLEPHSPTSPIRVRSRAVRSSDPHQLGTFEPSDLLALTGTGFRIAGRTSDLINCGGKKVAPAEIELVISQCPGVYEVVVFSSRNDKIHALVVGSPAVTPQVLHRHCAAKLPAWQNPRAFHLVDQIPRTPRGKISRRELAERFA